MGYDICRLDRDGNEVEHKLSSEQRMEIGRRGDFDDPDMEAGADGLGPCYLRRNIWGGVALAQTLVDQGLGYYRSLDAMDWDLVEASKEAYDAEHGEGSWGELAQVDRFRVCPQLREGLSLTLPDTPGINAAKLCGTNDGWIVTAVEYRSMLGLLEGLPAVAQARLLSDDWGTNGGFGPDFYAFAQACAQSGGSETW